MQHRRLIAGQPDDPGSGCRCPHCGGTGRIVPDPDASARKVIRANAGAVHVAIIAEYLGMPRSRVERLAKRFGFDLALKPEHEPRGA